jgi:transcriptional regulator with XRE-family HTH domain
MSYPSKCNQQLLNLNHQQRVLQELLRQVRKEAGLHQQELAVKLCKPQSFVSKYESGERRLDLLELRHICQCLNVELIVFVQRLEMMLSDQHESKR